MDKRLPSNRGAEAVLGFQPNSSMSIAYHPNFGPHDELLLLELDEKLLTDVLCEKVFLRGDPNEEAVLCTQSKTYAVKFVGTSNSVFLIPPSEPPLLADNQMDCDEKDAEHPALASVLKVATGSLEILEVAPKLDKLKLLLSQTPYTEEGSEMDITSYGMEHVSGLYTWDDLTEQIQASDVELRLGLDALDALEINGYWRIIDPKYMDSILIMLLHNTVYNDWSWDAVPENELVNTLESDGFPSIIATHCLRVYGSKVDTGSYTGALWKLDERRVCVHFAKEILKDEKMRMEKFMEIWRSKIPHGIVPSSDMLEGEVLTERIGVEIWVRSFSVSSLPSTPAERFSILFKERPKWVWKDLEPYIRDLKVPGLSSEGLLLKYTRRSQPTPISEPIFSAR